MPALNKTPTRMSLNEMGGAYVRRPLVTSEGKFKAGDVLSVEYLASMPASNRDALIRSLWIEPFPKQPAIVGSGPIHLVSRGGGRYDVISGVILNDRLLSKEEGEALIASRSPKIEAAE